MGLSTAKENSVQLDPGLSVRKVFDVSFLVFVVPLCVSSTTLLSVPSKKTPTCLNHAGVLNLHTRRFEDKPEKRKGNKDKREKRKRRERDGREKRTKAERDCTAMFAVLKTQINESNMC